MKLGHVYPDADGAHPHCTTSGRSYVGLSFLQANNFDCFESAPTGEPGWHTIMLAVPESMHRNVVDTYPPVRANAALVPWADSGIGLMVVHAASDAVLAVVDLAGRLDLTELQAAAGRGKLRVGIASDADPNVTPLVRAAGFPEALAEARTLRRLTARELAEAVGTVRALLRGPSAHALLGIPPGLPRLDTLTVNACPL